MEGLAVLREMCRMATTELVCRHVYFCRWKGKAEFPCDFSSIAPPCPVEQPECPVDGVDYAQVGVNLAGIILLYASAKISPWLKEKLAEIWAIRRARKDVKMAVRVRAIAAGGDLAAHGHPRNPLAVV